ncbi:MAG TPA: AAA family ATPase [bacterium]|nr:AAA family ATPase [bacterium]
MYEAFFGFDEKPFTHTPNTKFLYLSEQHEEVLKTLLYGLESRIGFMLLTGEVGSGKTTTIRTLLNIVGSSIETCFIFNPLVNTLDLLRSINRDFGNEWETDSLQKQIDTLNQYLLKLCGEGKTAAVIVDESQNLSFEALEMIRMLSNLETESEKLLNIILVGQPELEEKLATPQLRQLSQRIQIHVKLKPLGLAETSGYIQHRLNISGPKVAAYFEKTAVKKIFKRSRGIPRLINSICDLSLMAAFCLNTRVIDDKVLSRALREVPSYVAHP